MHAATTPAAVANKEMRVSPLSYDWDSRLRTVLGCGTQSQGSKLRAIGRHGRLKIVRGD